MVFAVFALFLDIEGTGKVIFRPSGFSTLNL